MLKSTKQTARTMRQMVGCRVNYRGTDGEIVGIFKAKEWMMRVALDDGRTAILKPSELA